MPTQEDRVLSRIRQTSAYIRDARVVKLPTLEAWALTQLGVRSRTLATYLNALCVLSAISINPKTSEITWKPLEGQKI